MAAHAVFTQTVVEKVQYDSYIDGVQVCATRFCGDGFKDEADVEIYQANGIVDIVPLTDVGYLFCTIYEY